MSYTVKFDNGDMVIGPDGRFQVVTGLEKCAQDIAESLLNNWDPDYVMYYNGSELWKIDRNPEQFSVIPAEEQIRLMVEDAITRLMSLQEIDEYADDAERIDRIADLNVSRLGSMTYGFYLRAITTSDEDLPMDFNIELKQMTPPDLETTGMGFMIAPTTRNKSFM